MKSYKEYLKEDLYSLEQQLTKDYPLKSLSIYMYDSSTIKINLVVIIDKYRNEGYGTYVMEDICEYADKYKYNIILTPSQKDAIHGTTSYSRLVAFYKRFGFIENTGPKKDYKYMDTMIRYAK
jgi:GNAT superfamily N-acetyltransferase